MNDTHRTHGGGSQDHLSYVNARFGQFLLMVFGLIFRICIPPEIYVRMAQAILTWSMRAERKGRHLDQKDKCTFNFWNNSVRECACERYVQEKCIKLGFTLSNDAHLIHICFEL